MTTSRLRESLPFRLLSSNRSFSLMPLDSTGPESLSAHASNRSRLSLILRTSRAGGCGRRREMGRVERSSRQLRPLPEKREKENTRTEGLGLGVVCLGGHG